jgi:hypothetical protein
MKKIFGAGKDRESQEVVRLRRTVESVEMKKENFEFRN